MERPEATRPIGQPGMHSTYSREEDKVYINFATGEESLYFADSNLITEVTWDLNANNQIIGLIIRSATKNLPAEVIQFAEDLQEPEK